MVAQLGRETPLIPARKARVEERRGLIGERHTVTSWLTKELRSDKVKLGGRKHDDLQVAGAPSRALHD